MISAISLALFFLVLTLGLDLSGETSGAIWGGALAAGLIILFAAIDRFDRTEAQGGKKKQQRV